MKEYDWRPSLMASKVKKVFPEKKEIVFFDDEKELACKVPLDIFLEQQLKAEKPPIIKKRVYKEVDIISILIDRKKRKYKKSN